MRRQDPHASPRTSARAGSRRVALLVACGALSCASASEQDERARPRLTLDDVFHPELKLDFSGDAVEGLAWLDERRCLWPERELDGRTTWFALDALTGERRPFLDAERMSAALAALEGVGAERARDAAYARKLELSPARDAALFVLADDLVHYRLGASTAQRLTRDAARERVPGFSPDGARVAFVREHDLWVVDVASGEERRVTSDGSPSVLNGELDWLYQEEVYGRGNYRSHWWSPDGARLAFLRLDTSAVPSYTIVDDMDYRPEVTVYPYPKAGDPNPSVRLGIHDLASGETRWTNVEKYAGYEPLIVDVAWSDQGDVLAWQVQDREQRWLELNFADPATGESRTLVRETTPAWVDKLDSPRWLADGSFLWFSERDGWKHLYHYRADGSLLRRVTTGEHEVRALHGVDEQEGWVYVTSTARSPIGEDVYRVRLDGGAAERLTQGRGTHAALFNGSLSHFLDTWSNLSTPAQVRLLEADGTSVRIVDANPVPALAEKGFVEPELMQVPTRDGTLLEALLIKPPDFDPSRTYPVYQHTYAGPHAPLVRDRWAGTRGMFWQVLAQRGVVVWVCDNRSASGKGAVSAWPVYRRLVETELVDIEAGLDWLRAQPWVDAERIGIGGWSYGGLMTLYALTHSQSFRMGIAGGPVSDWRNYDSIYTERYMRTPANNPEGYRATAPRFAARDLHGELLLIHGAIDDNVHPQNTLQMAHALQEAGILFQMMLYPKSKHAVTDDELVHHLHATMLAFIERTLLSKP